MAPERVSVPAVVLFRGMPFPPRMAVTDPCFISNVPMLVSVPLPMICPLLPPTVTVPTVSMKAPRSRMPPLTVTPPEAMTLSAP